MIRISVVSSPLPPAVKSKPLRSTSGDEDLDPETLSFLSGFLKAIENDKVKYSAIIQLEDGQEESLEQLTELFTLAAPETLLSVSFGQDELPASHPLVDQGVSLVRDLLEEMQKQVKALRDLEDEEFL